MYLNYEPVSTPDLNIIYYFDYEVCEVRLIFYSYTFYM